MKAPEAVRIEVERSDSGIEGRWISGTGRAVPLSEPRLGPEDRIELGERSHRLAEVVDALIRFDQDFLARYLTVRGQLTLGQYLFDQVFPPGADPPAEADLRLVSRDEHLVRLPWSLLAREGVFLAANGWSVSIAHENGPSPEVELPPSPRVLIAAPEPQGILGTDAEAHLEDLIELLSAADHYFLRGQHLRVVNTWRDFRTLARELAPHAVYYYGHGIGDADSSKLIFAEGREATRHDVSLADFAQALRRDDDTPPVLVYVNACQGDAGGLLGAGMQLGNFVPAVVTNRTVASVVAAQKQALEFWRSVLLEGVTPHRAVARMHNQLGNLDLTFDDTRWMTPVIHTHYSAWRGNPPQPVDRSLHDYRWHLKLDRVDQFARVAYETRQMLREGRPRCRIYAWYGARGQGVDLFHERLKVELAEVLDDTKIYELRPLWPEELEERHRAFGDMIQHATQIRDLDDLAGRIRSETRALAGRRTLVLFRHQPLYGGHTVGPSDVADYCEWFDLNIAPRLREAGVFGLVQISWFADKPDKLRRLLDRRLGPLDLQHGVWRVLSELRPLVAADLEEFLQTHNIRLPIRRRNRIIEEILAETRGHYLDTLDRLKDLVSRAWDLDTDPDDEGEDDEDF